MIESVLPYMTIMVKKLSINMSLPKATGEDILQDIMLAVAEADPNYDPGLGKAYLSYMHDVANTVIRRYLNEMRNSTMPLTRWGGETAATIRAIRARLQQQYGREPRNREVAEEMGVTLDAFESLRLRYEYDRVSPHGSDAGSACLTEEDVGWEEVLEDPVPSAADTAAHRETQEIVQGFVKRLTEEEQSVLTMLFGLGWDEENSLRETAENLGVSHQHVANVRERCFRKMRGRGLAEATGIDLETLDLPLNAF